MRKLKIHFRKFIKSGFLFCIFNNLVILYTKSNIVCPEIRECGNNILENWSPVIVTVFSFFYENEESNEKRIY